MHNQPKITQKQQYTNALPAKIIQKQSLYSLKMTFLSGWDISLKVDGGV